MEVTLSSQILEGRSGLLFYGLTPPKAHTEPDKMAAIAARQIARLQPNALGFALDGLVLYDLQDESSRTDMPRPFPFMQTLPPEVYARDYLATLPVPKIIYQSVGKHTGPSLRAWMREVAPIAAATVFVGSPSKHQVGSLSLRDAYAIKQQDSAARQALGQVCAEGDFPLGGVTIPERHAVKGDEHERLLDKARQGCSFFISQCIYNLDHAKDLLSDYHYACQRAELKPKPMVFTLTPCGSAKSLQFMEWLGIDIPRWLRNDLSHAQDILRQSLEACLSIAGDLIAFAAKKQIPIGFNIESVAIRKEEIDASFELLAQVRRLQG
jgi:Methylenetetrahydrofolate reductase